MTAWLAPDDARLPIWWPASKDMLEDELVAVLASARVECEEFAPTLAADIETAPVNYLHAQALQARALARAGFDRAEQAPYGDPVGTVWPMDWTVKALLRPAGRPRIGRKPART